MVDLLTAALVLSAHQHVMPSNRYSW